MRRARSWTARRDPARCGIQGLASAHPRTPGLSPPAACRRTPRRSRNAADHAIGTIPAATGQPWRTVLRRLRIIRMPAVLNPLQQIGGQRMDTPAVRFRLAKLLQSGSSEAKNAGNAAAPCRARRALNPHPWPCRRAPHTPTRPRSEAGSGGPNSLTAIQHRSWRRTRKPSSLGRPDRRTDMRPGRQAYPGIDAGPPVLRRNAVLRNRERLLNGDLVRGAFLGAIAGAFRA